MGPLLTVDRIATELRECLRRDGTDPGHVDALIAAVRAECAVMTRAPNTVTHPVWRETHAMTGDDLTLTMNDLVNAIHEGHLPLHIAVQLTPDVLAELWNRGEFEPADEINSFKPDNGDDEGYFNALAGRIRDAGVPTLEEIVDAVTRGPAIILCEGMWDGKRCLSTSAYNLLYVRYIPIAVCDDCFHRAALEDEDDEDEDDV